MQDFLDKDDIRKAPCPECGAEPEAPCVHKGKGSTKKGRNGVNHRARMELAQALYGEGKLALSDIEVIDYDDDPAFW